MSDMSSSSSVPAIVRLNPSTLLDATGIGNSQISVVPAGKLAFVAGQTATRRDDGPVPNDLAGQAKVVAGLLVAALKELGASTRDVVTFRMYVVNATTERFKEAWQAIHNILEGEMPSATAIGVQALWTPELQLQVEMTVRVP